MLRSRRLDTARERRPALPQHTRPAAILAPAGAAPAAPAAAAKRYSKARPYFARVAALEGLCSIKDKKSDKDTVRVELDLGNSGLTYSPGDALGVYPTNDPKARAAGRRGLVLFEGRGWRAQCGRGGERAACDARIHTC